MDETLLTNLGPPRFEIGRTLLIAGLGERYNGASCASGHPDLQTSPSRVRQHSLNSDRADAAAYCAPSIFERAADRRWVARPIPRMTVDAREEAISVLVKKCRQPGS